MKLKGNIELFFRLFRRFRIYAVYCSEEATYNFEDPRCPWRWRGSGCYDVTIYALNTCVFLVTARDFKEALDVRDRCLDEDLQSEIELQKSHELGPIGDCWLASVKERICYGMDVRCVRKTEWPVYASDARKCIIDTLRIERQIESKDINVIRMFPENRIAESFRYKMADWSRKRNKEEINRLSKIIENESSYLLRIVNTFRKEKCGRPQGSGRTAAAHL